jgi:hypothetical protein
VAPIILIDMNAAPHPLDKLISDAREKIARVEREFFRVERELERARDQLATLEMARKAVGDLAAPSRSPRRNGRQQRAGRRTRALSEGWQKVLRAIGREGESDLDRIVGYCTEAGLEIERQTLRSQMANYVKRGYLDRPREGVFRLTTEGGKAAGLLMPVEAGAPPESGGTP